MLRFPSAVCYDEYSRANVAGTTFGGREEKQIFMSGFRKFASTFARVVGSRWAFLAATGIVVAWAIVGSAFGFSEIWLLLINTVATIITFLMVFLIQNS